LERLGPELGSDGVCGLIGQRKNVIPNRTNDICGGFEVDQHVELGRFIRVNGWFEKIRMVAASGDFPCTVDQDEVFYNAWK
jgi:hypothetical protein